MSIHELYDLFKKSTGVSTDSRTINPGVIYFALKGPTFNGNKFAGDSLKKGASFAVIDENDYREDERFILVDDVLLTLQHLANHHIKSLKIPVLAIAGSNGKTTTKELIIETLRKRYKVYGTEGNLNNEIGVPLTILRIMEGTEIAIIEMGAKHRGDIAFLCNIAEPTHGIITNAGKDHLETFKTVENIIDTNAELFDFLKLTNGTAFIRTEHEYLLRKSIGVKKIILYGTDESSDCAGELISSFPAVELKYTTLKSSGTVESNLPGSYNFENILAAICIASHFKVNDAHIAEAIKTYKPTNNRSQVIQHNSNTYLLDAYNANPTSMQEALQHFNLIPSSNKVLILGDMLEIGESSVKEHEEILLQALKMDVEQVVLVGAEFKKVFKKEAGVFHFDNVELLKPWLENQHYKNTYFLLKGSRGIALEKALSI